MKIMIFSRLYHGIAGGIERMSISMANEMVARGHQVDILSLDRQGASTHFPLDPKVIWHKLDMGDAMALADWPLRLARIRRIRSVLRSVRPDVVIAFQSGAYWSALSGALGQGIPVIAAERSAPHRFEHLKAGSQQNIIFQSFRLAARVTVQFPDYIKAYPSYLHAKMEAIENPVFPALAEAIPAGIPGTPKRLISVGRLSYQKNQSSLISAFAQLAEKHPDWKLVLIGDGEDRTRLEAEAKPLGTRVIFTGALTTLSEHYKGAHLFCLASRWEGFPNAVAEAMAHGLPCVGFRECAGMAQLIADEKTGVLANGNNDPRSLAAALGRLMGPDADETRAVMGRVARNVVSAYNPDQIFDRWEELFHDVGGKK